MRLRKVSSVRSPLSSPLIVILLIALLAFSGCAPAGDDAAMPEADEEAAVSPGQELAMEIEKAHGADAWRSKAAFESGIVIEFGGNTAVDGKMLVEIGRGRSRFEFKDGTTLVFDGEHAWVSPSSASLPRARFHARTWPYFLAAPMKLRDPGTDIALSGMKELFGKSCPTAELTFDSGVGDSPDDWYVVYQDPETNRLAGLSYIVTYGTSMEEAEKEPHSIKYGNFVEIEGVRISTEWSFWPWTEEKGFHGDPLGKATLSNPQFVEPAADAFEKPADAKEDKLPE